MSNIFAALMHGSLAGCCPSSMSQQPPNIRAQTDTQSICAHIVSIIAYGKKKKKKNK
jgi:hypothetical protein